MIFHSKKAFLLPTVWSQTECTRLKEELADLFLKLPRVWYSLFSNTDIVDRSGKHFANV